MLDFRLKNELYNALLQWIEDVAKNNNISYLEMEDTVARVMLDIKDKALKEYLIDLQKKEQEYAMQQQKAVEVGEPMSTTEDYNENETFNTMESYDDEVLNVLPIEESENE